MRIKDKILDVLSVNSMKQMKLHKYLMISLLILAFILAQTLIPITLASTQKTITIKIQIIGKGLISVKYEGENNETTYLQITRSVNIQPIYGSLISISVKPAKGFIIQSVMIDGETKSPSNHLALKVGYDVNESIKIVLSPELPKLKESPSLTVVQRTSLLSDGAYAIEAVVRVSGNIMKNSKLKVGLYAAGKTLAVKRVLNVTPNYFTYTFSLKPPIYRTYVIRAYLITQSNETLRTTEAYIVIPSQQSSVEQEEVQNLMAYVTIALSLIAVILVSALITKRKKVKI